MGDGRTMISRTGYLAAVCTAALAFGCATPGWAASKSITTGPFSDMRSSLPLDTNGPQFSWTYHGCINNWDGGNIGWINDLPPNSALRQIAGVVYTTSPKGNFQKGNVVVTTIFGQDLNPGGTDLEVTGYMAGSPEVDFLSHATFGKSGKTYNASSSSLVAIGDLAAVLGPDFDLSPFRGDPTSVVRVFETTVPAKDTGGAVKGVLLTEGFDNASHVGSPNGTYEAGFDLPGTQFHVVAGDVTILGVKNGISGKCNGNPTGNCLDLIASQGYSSVQTIGTFNLDPKYTYTIQFTVEAQSPSGVDQPFTASLGDFSAPVTATNKPQQMDIYYTPTEAETKVTLGFGASSVVEGQIGPVLSGVVLCAHPAGSKKLNCPVPPP